MIGLPRSWSDQEEGVDRRLREGRRLLQVRRYPCSGWIRVALLQRPIWRHIQVEPIFPPKRKQSQCSWWAWPSYRLAWLGAFFACESRIGNQGKYFCCVKRKIRKNPICCVFRKTNQDKLWLRISHPNYAVQITQVWTSLYYQPNFWRFKNVLRLGLKLAVNIEANLVTP